METPNLEPKKRGPGRPWPKKEKNEEKQVLAEVKELQPNGDTPQATHLEADKVELGIDYKGLNATKTVYDIVADIGKKHPDKHMAFVYRENAVQAGQYWKILQIINGDQDVEEVDHMDKAYKTHWCVLCWRDKKIQDYVDGEQAKKQRLYNQRIESPDEYRKSIDGLKQNLHQITPELSARPLGGREDL